MMEIRRYMSPCENPNREVGDASFQPTESNGSGLGCGLANPPTGRLGIFHFSLLETGRAASCNPPTGRLGIFHFSLLETGRAASCNPPTGRLGIFHISLQRVKATNCSEWTEPLCVG
jgi:hypothetical protein